MLDNLNLVINLPCFTATLKMFAARADYFQHNFHGFNGGNTSQINTYHYKEKERDETNYINKRKIGMHIRFVVVYDSNQIIILCRSWVSLTPLVPVSVLKLWRKSPIPDQHRNDDVR